MVAATLARLYDRAQRAANAAHGVFGPLGSRNRSRDASTLPRQIYGDAAVAERRFLNVGAGSFRHPAWTNVDYVSDWYDGISIDIHWDLFEARPLEVESNWAHVVYTSHTLEHVNDTSARNFFVEAFRVLRPGGILRISVPDADLALRAWRRNDRDFFLPMSERTMRQRYQHSGYRYPQFEASTSQLFLATFATSASDLHVERDCPKINDEELFELFLTDANPTAAFDQCTSRTSIELQRRFPGNHMNWWTGRKLLRFLDETGFATTYRSGRCQSACPTLRDPNFFDTTHWTTSVYVEAIK